VTSFQLPYVLDAESIIDLKRITRCKLA